MLTDSNTKQAWVTRTWNPAEATPQIKGDIEFKLSVRTSKPEHPLRYYEVREIPKPALLKVRDFDRQIRKIMQAKAEYLEANHKDWPLVGGKIASEAQPNPKEKGLFTQIIEGGL